MNRRRFLRGAGTLVLGLPFLESLAPKTAKAQTMAPRRFVGFFQCNGINMDRFWPANYGPLTDASLAGRALEPLTRYRSKLLIPRGIHTVPRGFGWDPSNGCDHRKGMGHKLTAQPLGASGYPLGASVDQEMARAINPMNTPSLTLMVGYRANNVLGHISYSGSEQPVTGEQNPNLAYQDLVGLSGVDETLRNQIITRRQSIIDLVADDFATLNAKRLSAADRRKLDMHLTYVRDLERVMDTEGLVSCTLDQGRAAELENLNANNVEFDSEFKRIGRMQMDLIAMSLACGATKVATLQLGSGAGGPIYTWDGMNHGYNHHKLSHGNTRDDDSGTPVDGWQDMIHEIDRWHAGELAYLLDRISSYDEGDGTMLDNTAVLWMNELSHGKDHDFRDMPYVLAGSCGGYFKQNEYLRVSGENTRGDSDAPHNKLLTTLLNAVGVPTNRFGSAEFGEPGELEALKA
jgi:hypothetical protein